MASIAKHGTGYRAQVYVHGVRSSKKFRTKSEANAWAMAQESKIKDDESSAPGDRYTLGEAVERYINEVAPRKRGQRWEVIRLRRMERELPFSLPLSKITPAIVSEWRDSRRHQVSDGSVLREIHLLSSVFDVARRDWEWIHNNPVRNVRKPSKPAHRERIITRSEIKAMLREMGYSPHGPVRSVAQACAVCFLLALRTGMRAGELCGLTWGRVFDGYCHLPVTKTVPRDVPLTAKAMRVIEKMRGFDDERVFGIGSQTLSTFFKRYRERAGLSGFVFHDARHTAATWMALKVDALTLCKIFGWTQTSQALIYFNPSAADIARRLG
jgi:integrase